MGELKQGSWSERKRKKRKKKRLSVKTDEEKRMYEIAGQRDTDEKADIANIYAPPSPPLPRRNQTPSIPPKIKQILTPYRELRNRNEEKKEEEKKSTHIFNKLTEPTTNYSLEQKTFRYTQNIIGHSDWKIWNGLLFCLSHGHPPSCDAAR